MDILRNNPALSLGRDIICSHDAPQLHCVRVEVCSVDPSEEWTKHIPSSPPQCVSFSWEMYFIINKNKKCRDTWKHNVRRILQEALKRVENQPTCYCWRWAQRLWDAVESMCCSPFCSWRNGTPHLFLRLLVTLKALSWTSSNLHSDRQVGIQVPFSI